MKKTAKAKRSRETPPTDSDARTPSAHPILLGGLTALFVATPLVPSEAAGQGSGLAFVLLWLFLLIGWFTTGLVHGRLEIRWDWTTVALAALLVLHSISAMIVVGAGQGNGRPAINMLWQWVSFGLAFFLVRQLVLQPIEARALCAVMVGLAVCLSVHALYQYAYSMPLTRAQYERDPERALRDAGIHAPPGSPQREHFENRLRSREPTATFALTNSLAGYLAPWLVFAAGIGVAGTKKLPWPGRTGWGVIACLALMGVCFLLTKSRTAWLAAGLGVVLMFTWIKRPDLFKKPWVWAGAFIMALAGSISVFVVGRKIEIIRQAAASLRYRFEYWIASLQMIWDSPWFGCGPGNFQFSYTRFKLPAASEEVGDPHNFLLEIWSTAGTPALLAFLALLVCFVWQNRRTARREEAEAACQTAAGRSDLWIYAGGLAGLLLAFPCGWIAGFPLGTEIVLWCLPAAAVCVSPVHGWVKAGQLPTPLLLVPIVVLLVNLLAAGGIGFPGIAQTFWLLTALSLTQAGHGTKAAVLPRGCTITLLIVGVLLTFAFQRTAWLPVLKARTALARGADSFAGGHLRDAETDFQSAAQADRWSPEPWLYLAAVYHHRWTESQASGWLEKFRRCVAEAERRNPQSNALFDQVGRLYLASYRRSGESGHLENAIEAFERAVELYPNSNMGHAQLAWTYWLAGRRERSRREAAEALRLDSLNPHRELKLAQRIVFDPGPHPRSQNPQPILAPGGTAEQLMLKLRIGRATASESAEKQ